MGTDTRVWIHKEDLKNMDLDDALFIYENFTGRWQYTMIDRFQNEESNPLNTISTKQLKEQLIYDSNISQLSRNIVKRLKNFRIIFQPDSSSVEFDFYLDLTFYLQEGWEKIRKEIII